ncbi:MAG: NAD(P)H-dependent oxidoreductase [Pseudomonadota bacterium]
MKILAFAATNSKQSINRQLLQYASSLLSADVDIELLDLNDFEMPLYGIDREQADGIPAAAQLFMQKIAAADAVLISFAEHNGAYSVAYKNIYDWASRIDMRVYQDKPTVMLSTSPGGGGGASVLAAAVASSQFNGARLQASLSIPSFFESFDVEAGHLKDQALIDALAEALKKLEGAQLTA